MVIETDYEFKSASEGERAARLFFGMELASVYAAVEARYWRGAQGCGGGINL
jgi:hypothetical protein